MRMPYLIAIILAVGCGSTVNHTARAPSSAELQASSAMLSTGARAPVDFEPAIRSAFAAAGAVSEGKNADYIPELAKVDSKLFGIAVMRVDGELYEVGDAGHPFTIQSISKVFTLARVLQDAGPAQVEKLIGTNATGQAFNSLIALALNQRRSARRREIRW